MKTYNIEDIKKFAKSSSNYVEDEENEQEKTYSVEDFDKAKTRMLKYIFYKKRTESEVRKKFLKDYSESIVDDVIENLKENGYLSDENYVEKAVNEFIALKHLSRKEIKYKLMAKGTKTSAIENFFDNNYDQLTEYEIKSAKHLAQKKKSQMEDIDIKRYLMKKGYSEESIKEAL